jgi:hypothetical protein
LKRFLALTVWLSAWLIGPVVNAEIIVRDRHVLLVYPGVDALWGNYVFMVSNEGDEPQRFATNVLLPNETVDWQAQDNLEPDDIQLSEDGGLRLSKVFDPGNHLLSIGFKVPSSGGAAALSLEPPFAMGMMGIFVSDQSLEVKADQFTKREDVPFSGQTYNSFTVLDAQPGTVYRAEISGLPEGRGRYWIVGSILALILVVGAGLATWKTKPRQTEESEVLS